MKKRPEILYLTIFFISFLILLVFSLIATQGRFIYPLDDSYIHINIAQNVAQHGIWGISKEGFTSLSSSPLWTVLLSGLNLVFGPSPIIPLILSALLAVLLLKIVFKWLDNCGIPPALNFFGISAILFLTPLLPLVFSGLEHILHALLVFLLICSAAKTLSTPSESHSWKWLWLAPLVVMARYESIFVIASVAFLFILKKKIWQPLVLFFGGTIPLAFFGFISLRQGWFFFPNSVYLKGRTPQFSSIKGLINWILEPWKMTPENFHVLLILVLSIFILLLLWLKKKTLWTFPMIMTSILSITLVQHIQFARIGSFYRYEAYLMIPGLFIFFLVIKEFSLKDKKQVLSRLEQNRYKIRRLEISLILFIIFTALGIRGMVSLIHIPQAGKNTYEQQYQMGLFLKTFYSTEQIAANDIGAIHFLADIQCLDLWGLSSMEVARAKKQNSFDVEFIDLITKSHQTKIAILYDRWFDPYGGLPSEWIKVGEWTIQNNVVCGGETVSFYAVDTSEKDHLIQHLREFSRRRPEDVIRKIGTEYFQ